METQLAAASASTLGPISKAIIYFLGFIDGFVVPLIFAIAFLSFIWGVYTYFIAGAADEEKRKKGKGFVLYSLIGFVLMLSLWGIINILTNTLGFSGYTRPKLPLFGSSTTVNQETKSNNFIDCLAAGGSWDDAGNNGAGTCSK